MTWQVLQRHAQLVGGIHDFRHINEQGVDGRDEPGHDVERATN
jgi:hypothetical protein